MPSLSFTIVGETKVRIWWTEPYNGGSPVISYQILFKNGLTFSEIKTYCDGTNPAIVTNHYCDIPFTEFRISPLFYTYNTLIIAKVSATNNIGTGLFSIVNTEGIKVQTEPSVPPLAPHIVSYSEFSIQLDINILTGDQTGGSPILYYDLSWDLGTNGF